MLKTAKKIKTLIFHPALAPYRVDLFNALAVIISKSCFSERDVSGSLLFIVGDDPERSKP